MEKKVLEWVGFADYLPLTEEGYDLYAKIYEAINKRPYTSLVTIQLTDDERALVAAAEREANEDDYEDYYDEDEDEEDEEDW